MAEVTTNMISLIPNNGTEFSVTSGQKVIFEVPPDVGFVKGRDSYLTFDVKNTTSDNRRIGFNNVAGGQALINRIDIYSLKSGIHLETLENINQWCGTENQYFYEDTANLTALEGCGQVVQAQIFNDIPNEGAANGDLKPVGLSAQRVADTLLSPVTKGGEAVYQFRRYTIPLRAGLFRWWDDERLCPVLQLGGLRIVLTLEDPQVAFSQVNPVDETTGPSGGSFGEDSLFPRVKGTFTTQNSPRVNIRPDGLNMWVSDPYDARDGDGGAVNRTGLAVGNSLQAWANSGAENTDTIITSMVEQTPLSADLPISDISGNPSQITITGKTIAELAADGIGVDTWVEITTTAPAATQRRVISSVTQNGGDVDCGVAGFDNTSAPLADGTGAFVNLESGARAIVAPAVANVSSHSEWYYNTDSWSPSALVRPELKVLSVVPMGMDMAKDLNYQFTSYDMFLSTLPTASRKHQVEVPSVATRAVAITSQYVRVGSESDSLSSGYFVGDAPSQTKLNEVQYYINNKLYPVRSYDPSEKKERIINQNENVKALSTINKEPKALGGAKAKDIEKYTNTYLNSRELAREDFVFNLRDAETQIRLGFSDGRPTTATDIKGGNRTIYTRVWSKKIVNISDGGLRVVL